MKIPAWAGGGIARPQPQLRDGYWGERLFFRDVDNSIFYSLVGGPRLMTGQLGLNGILKKN